MDENDLPQFLTQLLSPEFILTRIIKSYTFLIKTVRDLGDQAFEPVCDSHKPFNFIDLWVEKYFYTLIAREGVHVIRSEDIVPLIDLSRRERYCILTDVLDGAHLYQKRLGNWCSAITVFNRVKGRIYAAYIVLPAAEKIYFATDRQPGAFMMHVPGLSQMETFPFRVNHEEDYIEVTRKEGGWNRYPLTVPSSVKALMNATVCLYAQRCSALSALLDCARFPRVPPWLASIAAVDEELREKGNQLGFRFYNIGGNPMLARLCDGGADVVLDLGGSLPNDWVPGAYIALRAGAYVGSVDGKAMTERDLFTALTDLGRSRTPYIAASSESLYREALDLLANVTLT